MKTYAILLASGAGARFGGEVPKQFIKIDGKMIVEYTLEAFMQSSAIDDVIIVVSESYVDLLQQSIAGNGYAKPVKIVVGGKTRLESTLKGVTAIKELSAKVLIHNAVQPFISSKTLGDCVSALDRYDAVTVGSPLVYTVLELDEDRVLRHIVDRRFSVNDLGPECFKLDLLKNVLEMSNGDDSFTNITGMIVKYGLGDVFVVDGDPANIKITYPNDLLLAKLMLEERRKELMK